MIAGSCTSPFYYGLMCQEMAFWRWLWLGQIWFFCIAAAFVVIVPAKKRAWLNAVAFILASFSSIPGLLHLQYYADKEFVPEFNMEQWAYGGAAYVFGAVLYAMGFPEKYFPKTFDIWGASH
jgi:adiponectin receptor